MNRCFNFIGRRRIAYVVSAVVIFGSLLFGGVLKGPRFGIDFTGGVLVQVKLKEPTTTGSLRALFKGKVKGVTVQNVEGSNEFLIRAPASKDTQKVTQRLNSVLKSALREGAQIRRVEMIGPTVGKELRRKGTLALIYALLGILIYVAWRFEPVFAVGAILALIHDTLATVGMFMSAGREFSLPVVAGLLTVVGYSINDTIVVYDRVRENMKFVSRSKPFPDVVNDSINQTLSRTLITSLTTFFVVLCLYLFGGGIINDFAFVLLVGIVVGTYSSIFIASALVVDWYGYTGKWNRGK